MAGFSAPRGMQDILPDEWPYWDFVIEQARQVAALFGYRRIETPAVGDTRLFRRSVGEGTDIVDKEMYSFRHGGDELTLRPEGTAPVVRAYLEHGMSRWPQPVKLFYIERMYRAESPQRGRYREHRQFGCEAIGVADAYVDVEMIALLDTLCRRLGLEDVSLHLNSIGDRNCRPAYLARLVEFLRAHEGSLSTQDRSRIERNPLRVLDSKDPESQAVIAEAPKALDSLCSDCSAHWDRLLHGLGVLGMAPVIDHRLVRGIDYYTRTVFEFLPPMEGRQSVLAAGGRYDGLAEALGGPPTPGIGFGSGIERLILSVKECEIPVPPAPTPRVYVAHRGPGTEDQAMRVAARLRQRGISADMAFGSRNLGNQLKHADRRGAAWAAIIGEDELAAGEVTLRSLRDGEQRRVAADSLAQELSA